MNYLIHRTDTRPSSQNQWESDVWQQAETLQIQNFHPKSSEHRPKTEAKLLYDEENIYVLFRVIDRYVKAVYTQYQEPVCQDSCIEFFVMPNAQRGYFNLEMNCIGTMLSYYIEDWQRTDNGFKKYEPVPQTFVHRISRFHSLSGPIEKEIDSPLEWNAGYVIPFSFFEEYLGPLTRASGTLWKGNFYKCGDNTSHPHWASWVPIGEQLNFHQPEYFGCLEFGE